MADDITKAPRYEARDFPGMILGGDHNDLPPGAASRQINLSVSSIGEMVTRRGYKAVEFEDE